MISYRNPHPDELNVARHLFSDRLQVHDILCELYDHGDQQDTLSPQELYNQVQSRKNPGELAERIMRSSFGVKKAYRHFLTLKAPYNLGVAVAASNESIPGREIDGCRMRFQSSRHDTNQGYLILELNQNIAEAPTMMVLCARNGDIATIALNEPRNNVVQILLNLDSELATLLKKSDTEIFLQ